MQKRYALEDGSILIVDADDRMRMFNLRSALGAHSILAVDLSAIRMRSCSLIRGSRRRRQTGRRDLKGRPGARGRCHPTSGMTAYAMDCRIRRQSHDNWR